MTEFQLGSISTGTLRPEDLIPVFEAEVNSQSFPHVSFEGTTDEEYLEGMTQILNDRCPPFVYFGARQCKSCCTDEPCIEAGADFGFFVDWESLNAEISGHSQHDKFWLDENQCMVEVHPEGNVMLLDINGEVLWHT